jgi:hypothetical protein
LGTDVIDEESRSCAVYEALDLGLDTPLTMYLCNLLSREEIAAHICRLVSNYEVSAVCR